MASDKSLAAEIEAASVETLAEAIRRQVVLLRFNEANTLDQFFDADEIDLLCTRAANAVKDHFSGQLRVEAPALQGRAFEDGARWMRERAYGAVIDVRHAAACNFSPEFSGAQGEARTNSLATAAKAVLALPLQPEGERSDA